MKVKELIAKIQEFDGELEIVIETCCEKQYADNVRSDKTELIISSVEHHQKPKLLTIKN
jgi:hypothetical protein